MNLSADEATNWPEVIWSFGALIAITFLAIIIVLAVFESRKLKIAAAQMDELRQLISRFEHLAENTVDAQQRVAADLAELRSRTASIEQILRTVE